MSALMQWIEERSYRDVSGCLVWRLACAHGKEPQGRYMGSIIRVRRHVFEEARGKILALNFTVKCSCGTDKCVEPSHLVAKRRVGRKGQKWTLADRAKIAAATRASRRAKLDEQAVEDMRSRQEHRSVYAERYGIAPEYVTDIQGLRVWRDYANPFASLIPVRGAP